MKHINWVLLVIVLVFSVFITGCPKKTPPPLPPIIDDRGPAPLPDLPTVEPQLPQLELRTVYFDLDEYSVRADQRARLTDNAEQLIKFADIKVMLEGHCDERGTNEYNIALGEKRARAVKDFLTQYGIAATRLMTKSYGEERPVCTGHDEGCWNQNRRVEFISVE